MSDDIFIPAGERLYHKHKVYKNILVNTDLVLRMVIIAFWSNIGTLNRYECKQYLTQYCNFTV